MLRKGYDPSTKKHALFPEAAMFTFENHRLVPKPWRHWKICNQASKLS